ncbi:MAG: LbtU family siderophore porin [Desulfotignum sp.]|nr:LbtU family siderophore porin [Desulfobacteraceae bacterium]
MKPIVTTWRITVCLMFLTLLVSPAMAQDAASTRTVGGVKSMEDRVRHLEQALGRGIEGGNWFERIQVEGVIEFEAAHTRTRFSDPAEADEEENDLDLATVELAMDAAISDHVDGHVLFKYEEDDLFVDEGFITLSGKDKYPVFLKAGRQYLPFGYFDSHFVTDPTTLVLGETNDGAVVAGYRFAGDMVEISAGLFNGAVDETGEDDMIDSGVAAVAFQPFESVMMGVSYTSNLISSDGFSEAVVTGTGTVTDMVGGWSAYLTVAFIERFTFVAEYAAALDSFKAGEIYDSADTRDRKPAAWNLELGFSVLENLDLAIGYGGSDDGGAEFLPEKQYGAVANWGIFDSTNLALEFLRAEFDDDAVETDTVTLQLAIEF